MKSIEKSFARIVWLIAGLSAAAVPCLAEEGGTSPPDAETLARIERAIANLGADDWSDRETATEELVALGEVATERLLEAKRTASDVEVTSRIRRVLAATGGWAKDPDEVAGRIGEKLSAFESTEAFSFYSRNPDYVYIHPECESAIAELRELGPGAARAVAAAIERADNSAYRRNLVFVLGELGEPGESALLGRVLGSDADPQVRLAAAYALGRIAPGAQVDALVGAIEKDAERDVRVQALLALGRVREKDVVDRLIGYLSHPDANVRQGAAFSLSRLTRKEHGYNPYYPEKKRTRAIERWKSWWTENRDGFQFPELPEPDRGIHGYRGFSGSSVHTHAIPEGPGAAMEVVPMPPPPEVAPMPPPDVILPPDVEEIPPPVIEPRTPPDEPKEDR